MIQYDEDFEDLEEADEMPQFAICFEREPDEAGYPVCYTGFKSDTEAQAKINALPKRTRLEHKFVIVKYKEKQLQGGIIVPKAHKHKKHSKKSGRA